MWLWATMVQELVTNFKRQRWWDDAKETHSLHNAAGTQGI